MSPEYNKLFEFYDQNKKEQVIIAKINCSENEVFCREHHVHSYPNIKFYPANQKKAKSQFQGDRTFQELKNWISRLQTKEKPSQDESQNKNQEKNQKKIQEKNQKKTQENEENNDISSVIYDSSQLQIEIKKVLQDGLAENYIQRNENKQAFYEKDFAGKAEVLFDEIHSIRRELKELNIINQQNLKLLNRSITQADNLQDQRIVIENDISLLTQQIDLGKNQILNQIDTDSKNLQEIEKSLQEQKKQGGKKSHFKYFIFSLFSGLLIGYLITYIVSLLTKKSEQEENEELKLY
ncbi:Thioredoxin-like fold [Pseudocohnilembus persalinus]|uniref:Thioredoxin-like fold n=1 Tax=Pseudocohnilembus persalinus TaxID=266149 RepID=A0A0V0R924_PSEPJ|nr:Thioredoxin-like fold [Pseudocohnilembus persalinus]|eukprot:KRX11004.1 Thioredoxin-like fold [Pseudocohnilembus persalinus]